MKTFPLLFAFKVALPVSIGLERAVVNNQPDTIFERKRIGRGANGHILKPDANVTLNDDDAAVKPFRIPDQRVNRYPLGLLRIDTRPNEKENGNEERVSRKWSHIWLVAVTRVEPVS